MGALRVLLCTMPFGPANWPHLGLGLLQAGLARAGVDCDVRYFTIDFCRRVGRQFYVSVAEDDPSYYPTLAGEWIFASALFGARRVDVDGYLRWVHSSKPGFFTPEVQERLRDAQARAALFVEDCLAGVDWGMYDVVGFSSSLQQHNASLALARRVKEQHPGVTVVFGGNNVEGEMGLETLRRFDFVDYVCLGEGDALLPELVRRLRAGEALDDLPGLALRRDGRIHATPLGPDALVDLDGLPCPDYDDFFRQYVAVFEDGRWRGDLPLETSRGCPWGQRNQCTFCGSHRQWMHHRRKGPERALAEAEHLVRRYEPRTMFMVDMAAPRGLEAFYDGWARRGPRPRLLYELRAGMGKAQLARLKRAGMGFALIGIESLSTPILRLMSKGSTALTNVRALKWCRELGILAQWNLLYGFPLEEPAEYARMAGLIPSLAHLRPPSFVTPVNLLRFSPHYSHPARYGFANVRPSAAYAWIYPGLPEPALRNLARHFDYDYADGREPRACVAPLLRAVEAWREAASGAVLAWVDDGERLRLFDTRPAARQRVRVLAGLDRALYLACDRQRSLRGLRRRLAGEAGAIRPALERMVEERLMISEGGVYLSLAVDVGRHLAPERRAAASDEFCLALAHGLMRTEP